MANTTDKVDPTSMQRTQTKGKFDTNEKWQKKVDASNKVQEAELKKNNAELIKQGKLTEDQSKRSEDLLESLQKSQMDTRAKMMNPEVHQEMASSIGIQKDVFIAHALSQGKREQEKLQLQNEIKAIEENNLQTTEEGWTKRNELQSQIDAIDKKNEDWGKNNNTLLFGIKQWTKKTWEEIGKQSYGDILGDGFGGLKDDFMGLMGPASAVLGNIPFLKPIASMTGKLLMKTIHALTRTEFWEKSKMAMAKLRDKLSFKQWRMDRREKKKERKKPMKVEVETKGGDDKGDKGGSGAGLMLKLRGLAVVLPMLAAPIRLLGMTLASMAPIAGPMVIGAGALGLALAALGAGAGVGLMVLGAGLIVVGLGMVKLAKGFEAFTDLDGEAIRFNISEIGKSMGWLLGLAFIGTIASVAGKLSGGIPDLANSFKSFDPNIEGNVQGKDVASNITALGVAMESLSAIASTSLGTSFKGWVGSFFTDDGESPMVKLANDLRAFESVDGEALAAAAPGIITLSSAMNEWGKNAPETGVWDAIGAGLGSLFGTDMMSTLEKVANLPAGIDKKAEALKTVGEGFEALGEGIKHLNDQDLDKWWDYVVKGLNKVDHVTITPSVSVASIDYMMAYGSKSGVVINAAASAAAGAGGGGNATMNQANQVVNNINTSNSKQYVASGGILTDQQVRTNQKLN